MAFSCLVTWYMQQKVVGRGKKQEQYYICNTKYLQSRWSYQYRNR